MCWFFCKSKEEKLLVRIVHLLDLAVTKLNDVLKMEKRIMASLDELLAGVAELDTKEDSLIQLTTNIKAQLDAVLAGALTPAQQAKVDEIFAKVQENAAQVQTAIDANTPQ